MKLRIWPSARLARIVAANMLCGTMLFAADEAAPPQAPPAAPAQPQDATRANRGDRGRPPGGGENVPGRTFGGRGGFGGLNLDEKQNELLREAMQAESDELRKLYEKLQAAQKELVKAVMEEKYDDASVRQKADAVSKIQTDITVLRAKAFASVVPTLKPEQRDQIENNRAASSIITGTALPFGPGGGPQEQMAQDRNRRGDRGNNNPGGGDPNQVRRRGGDRPGGPAQ